MESLGKHSEQQYTLGLTHGGEGSSEIHFLLLYSPFEVSQRRDSPYISQRLEDEYVGNLGFDMSPTSGKKASIESFALVCIDGVSKTKTIASDYPRRRNNSRAEDFDTVDRHLLAVNVLVGFVVKLAAIGSWGHFAGLKQN